jgi:hypothetical protein
MGAERERIVSLQILRFVAAMIVVVFHTTYLVGQLPGTSDRSFFLGAAAVGPAGVGLFCRRVIEKPILRDLRKLRPMRLWRPRPDALPT